MRYIAEQSLRGFHHRLEPFGHHVEIATELAHFITSLD